MQALPLAAFENHLAQRGLARRAVEYGDIAEGSVILRRDLEATEVRGQEDDALAGPLRGLDMLPADYLGNQGGRLFEFQQPDTGQLEHLLAGFGRDLTTQGRIDAGLRHVFPDVPALGRRQQINQATEPAPQHM